MKGCRTPDDGIRPLQPGVLEINKDFRVEVGIREDVKQDKDDTDGTQLASTMTQLAQRMTSNKNDEDSIPLNDLKRRRVARLKLEAEGGKGGQENKEEDINPATKDKPTNLNETDEMELFDGADLVFHSAQRAVQRRPGPAEQQRAVQRRRGQRNTNAHAGTA